MPGHWAGSTRRDTLPANWPAVRRHVFKRDGWQCTEIIDGQRCTNRATDCDHIGDRLDHRPEMLRSKCKTHHAIKSSREGNAARAAVMATAYHKREKHPGIIE